MKRAHWTRRSRLFHADEYVCSACGTVSDRPYKACPGCGAVMGRTKDGPSWADEIGDLPDAPDGGR